MLDEQREHVENLWLDRPSHPADAQLHSLEVEFAVAEL
jgi:hypothetical protein